MSSPRGFFMETVSIITDGVEHLIRSAFRQDDYAVKYAIEPLLNRQGPLSELPVRLKLLLGLGMISLNTYQDLELFIRLRDWLCESRQDYRFSDPALLDRLQALHGLQLEGLPLLTAPVAADPLLAAMQLERQDQMVRSSLLLCVSALVLELAKESPI
ncbi:MltR family transcriptional regulator [Pseudaeromonas paramecii]|uniref:MltR family transcriptional regulator n=1 Tax=Pseudaeromonas paramecii TaxID=2138166 RepID=A0ABP8QCA3_9GAMM